MQDPAEKSPKIAIWAPSHNFVKQYLRNQGTHRQSEKKLVKQQYVLPMPSQYGGPLTAENDWRVCTSSYFSGYRVLAALLHGSQVVGVSQTLRR